MEGSIMEVGDRVKIRRIGHPANLKEGWILEISIHKDGEVYVLVGFIPAIPSPAFGNSIFDSSVIADKGNGYVLAPENLEIVRNRDEFDYQTIVDGIIDSMEDQGCPIRHYSESQEFSNYHNWPWRDGKNDQEEWMKRHYPEIANISG